MSIEHIVNETAEYARRECLMIQAKINEAFHQDSNSLNTLPNPESGS